MKKIIFKREGKIGNYKEDEKTLTAFLKVEIREVEGISWNLEKGIFKTLSIIGCIKYRRKEEYYGQIQDEIKKVYNCNNKLLNELLKYWKEYHLNDLTPGTKKQIEALKKANLYNGDLYADYEARINYLKEINLYEDRGYKYGHMWLIKPIPQQVIDRILYISNTIIK